MIIRIKEKNSTAALAAIPGSVLVDPPDYDYNVGLSDDYTIPAVGMVGLQLPDSISGKKAHKLLKAAGIVK